MKHVLLRPLLLLLLLLRLVAVRIVLQDGGQAEGVHPLNHALLSLGREVISPHVVMLGLKGELSVDAVVLRHDGADFIRGQEDRAAHFVLFGAFVIEKAEFREDKPALLPQHESIAALFIKPTA